MTDLLKKLHAELNALFYSGEEEAKDEAPKVVKNRKAKDIEEDEDEDEVTPVKTKAKASKPPVEEDEDEVEEEEAPKPKKGKATLVQVKAKLKEVLDEKGRDAAVALLEKFDGAEKVGDIDEENYGEFLFQAQRALEKKAKDSNIKKKAVKTEDEDDLDD